MGKRGPAKRKQNPSAIEKTEELRLEQARLRNEIQEETNKILEETLTAKRRGRAEAEKFLAIHAKKFAETLLEVAEYDDKGGPRVAASRAALELLSEEKSQETAPVVINLTVQQYNAIKAGAEVVL